MPGIGDILEPGERVVLRVPVLPLWQPALMTITGLILALPAASRLAAGSGDFVVDIALAAAGVFMLVVAVPIYRTSRICMLLVTDRRLLQRQGNEKYEEISLAAVDAVKPYRLGDGLFVAAQDQKIVVPCKEKTAARIREAIARAKGAA